MRRQDMLAESVLMTKGLTARYYAGFDEANRTRQAVNLPNHACWNLGHLALTMYRVVERLDGGTLPGDVFVPGVRGDAARFGTDSVSFKSEPVDDLGAYPSLARSVQVFDGACDRLAAAARAAGDAKLDELVPWGATSTPLWTLVLRMVYHNGMHTGQLADLRRGLGLARVLG